MQPDCSDPESMPLRFVPPDGWRQPDPQWVCFHQGFQPEPSWRPYPECPLAPPNWPFWEENGASWLNFFHYISPPPSRVLGWWFALAASGLFGTAVLPFALPWPGALVPEIIALLALTVGTIGVIRSFRSQSRWLSGDPLDRVRAWSAARKEEFLADAYLRHRQLSQSEPSFGEFEQIMQSWWWRENP